MFFYFYWCFQSNRNRAVSALQYTTTTATTTTRRNISTTRHVSFSTTTGRFTSCYKVPSPSSSFLFPLSSCSSFSGRHRYHRKTNRLFNSSSSHHNNNIPPLLHNTIAPKTETYHQKLAQLHSSSPLSLAPMMEYTDRHFRHMVRLISQNTLVYTEMVAANAIVHERQDALKRHDNLLTPPPPPGSLLSQQIQQDLDMFGYDMTYLRRFLGQGTIMKEGPSVLQLGGSDPLQLQQACETLLEMTQRGYCDYTAVNLNCGCPSPKVAGKGCFGAALMQDPELVKDLVIAMHNGCRGQLPITVKCRIGTDEGYTFTRQGYQEIDEEKEYGNLCRFIETVASSGVVTDFQIHARIAVLSKNFSPADNRKVPTLKYEVVRRLVEDYPELTFSLNGGINTIVDAKAELEKCPKLAGIMIGRAWAANPWSFAMADEILYPPPSKNIKKHKNRLDVLKAYGKHADMEETIWDPLKVRRFITKAATPLFAGEPMGKKYRIALDEIAARPKKSQQQQQQQQQQKEKNLQEEPPISELILQAAMENLSQDVLLRTPQESFEMLYGNEIANNSSSSGQGQSSQKWIIQDWQQDRKKQDGFQRH